MKLVGNKTEGEYRKALIHSQEKLFNDSNFCKLLKVIRANNSVVKTAYVISHTPEQGEDFFRVIVNGSVINLIEIDRLDNNIEPIFETMDISEYKKGLTKQSMIKLAVALDLSS